MITEWLSWLSLAISLALMVYNWRLCRRWIVLNMVQEEIVTGAWHHRMWLARLQQAQREAQQQRLPPGHIG